MIGLAEVLSWISMSAGFLTLVGLGLSLLEHYAGPVDEGDDDVDHWRYRDPTR